MIIEKAIIQPKKCRGCIWGKWQETKQVCFWPKCIKPAPIVEDELERARRLINQ